MKGGRRFLDVWIFFSIKKMFVFFLKISYGFLFLLRQDIRLYRKTGLSPFKRNGCFLYYNILATKLQQVMFSKGRTVLLRPVAAQFSGVK